MYWQQTTQNAHFNDANDTHNDSNWMWGSSFWQCRILVFFFFYRHSFNTLHSIHRNEKKSRSGIRGNEKKKSAHIDFQNRRKNRMYCQQKAEQIKCTHQQCNNAIVITMQSQCSVPFCMLSVHLSLAKCIDVNVIPSCTLRCVCGRVKLESVAILQSLICYRYADFPCNFDSFVCR